MSDNFRDNFDGDQSKLFDRISLKLSAQVTLESTKTINHVRILLYCSRVAQLTTPNPLRRRPEVSNSFSTVSHVYIPRFHTGQTLLKKNFSRQNCISVVPKLFVCRHRKPVDQISRHTSHINLFPLIASNIIWRSPLLPETIFGNRVM